MDGSPGGIRVDRKSLSTLGAGYPQRYPLDADSTNVRSCVSHRAADANDTHANAGCSIAIMAGDHIIFIVDDDRRVRESLIELLSSFDMHAVSFGSAAEYIASPKPDLPACLVLDVQLPDINGLELQTEIAQSDDVPIVFITAHGDIPSSVRAMKAGAVDFLTKPFREADLMGAINAALTRSREARRTRAELADLHQRLSLLTPREREVLTLVASGLLNKQAAAELHISEVTLQIHRARMMKKMAAGSIAELVRMVGTLQIPLTRTRYPNR
jgi:Response regulator